MKNKIYISAPISGYNIEERRATFKAVADILERQDYIVFNPMDNGVPAEAATRYHMRADIKMMLQSDEVVFLDKWLHSAGCHTEFMVAAAIGLTIHFGTFENGVLTMTENKFR